VGRRTWDARRRRRAGDSCHPLLLPARGNRPPVTPLTYAALGGQCLAQRIANAALGAPSDQGNALLHACGPRPACRLARRQFVVTGARQGGVQTINTSG
jgi:hypothetical protein